MKYIAALDDSSYMPFFSLNFEASALEKCTSLPSFEHWTECLKESAPMHRVGHDWSDLAAAAAPMHKHTNNTHSVFVSSFSLGSLKRNEDFSLLLFDPLGITLHYLLRCISKSSIFMAFKITWVKQIAIFYYLEQ